jgi:putative transposase
MHEYESVSHTKWNCKYHVVFIPKCRRRTIYGQLRPHLGEVFRKLAQQKESRIEEGHLLADHVQWIALLPLMKPTTCDTAYFGGIEINTRVYGEKKRSFVGQHYWARGYFVSTVGRGQELIREYIKKQEAEDMRMEQLNLRRRVAAFRRLLQTGGASARF